SRMSNFRSRRTGGSESAGSNRTWPTRSGRAAGILEAQTCSELNRPSRAGARDYAEGRRAEREPRDVEVRAVQNGVGLHANVELRAAAERDGLLHGRVERRQPGTTQHGPR